MPAPAGAGRHLVRWASGALLPGVVVGRAAPSEVAIGLAGGLASVLVAGVVVGTVVGKVAALRSRSGRIASAPGALRAIASPLPAACAVLAALVGIVRGLPPPVPELPPRLDVARLEGTVVEAPRLLGPRAADEGAGEAEAILVLDVGGIEARGIVALAPDPGDARARRAPGGPPGPPDLLPGDRVRVTGSVRVREPTRNPGARTPPPGSPPTLEFECPSTAALELVAAGGGPRWLLPRLGERLHRVAVDRLRAACGDDPACAGFLACVLVGERSGVAPETSRAFRDSGTAHLLAVSGLHLVVLAGALVALGRAILPAPLLAPVGGPFLAATILLYVAACRFEVPVVRSALFVALAAVARLAGRRGAPWDALALAAGLVVLADPGQVFDAGFQLSFVAVAGLSALTQRFREALFARLDLLARFPEATPRWRLRAGSALATGLSASLAASVATAPVVAWHFGTAQPAAPVANLVAVPLFGALLPAAAGLAIVGPWVPSLAAPLGAAGTFALETSATAFSGASVVCGRPPGPLVALSAAMLAAAAALRPWQRVHLAFPAVAWCAVAVAPAWVRPPPGVETIALDVGHGSAVLVRAEDAALLFDAGGRAPATGERVLVPALRTLGVRRLAGLWISHEDSDHVDGAREVLRDVLVEEVVVPEGFGASPLAAGLLSACADAAVPVRAVRRGDRWRLRGLAVEVLDPHAPAVFGAENSDSLVAHVVARLPSDRGGEVSVLLPGDVEGPRLGSLLADATLPRADVLLLPHHGRGDPALHVSLARRARASVLVASTSESVPTEVPGAWVTGASGAVRVRRRGAPEAWPW